MATSIAHTWTTVEFDTALRTLATRAHSRYAGESVKIDRGLVLALNGHVTLHADGTAFVRSAKNPEIYYRVAHGSCDCPDGTRAPDKVCKHRWASCLMKKAQRAPVPLPSRFFATYYPPSGAMIPGIATLTDRGWLFIGDAGEEPQYVDINALCRGGNMAIAEAQRDKDGDLVRKVCFQRKGYDT